MRTGKSLTLTRPVQFMASTIMTTGRMSPVGGVQIRATATTAMANRLGSTCEVAGRWTKSNTGVLPFTSCPRAGVCSSRNCRAGLGVAAVACHSFAPECRVYKHVFG